ncbi:MAG: hypothetical protein AAGJ37_17305 [Pseudomonadota bacterium]
MFSLGFRLFLASILFLASCTLVYASSDKLQWQWYLIGIAVISSLASYVIIKQKKSIETFGIKVLIWGTYFWVFTFAQLTLLAILYYLYE